MYNPYMCDLDLIPFLMKHADPAKAEMLAENARLRAENEQLFRQLLRMRQKAKEAEREPVPEKDWR